MNENELDLTHNDTPYDYESEFLWYSPYLAEERLLRVCRVIYSKPNEVKPKATKNQVTIE